jgi:hypothetical protein
LLLILQRFDNAKWGYFTECPQSGVKVEPGTKLLTVSFVADEETGQRITIIFYPDDHEIYLGTTLIGRGTNIIGGREGPHRNQCSSAIQKTFEREMTLSSRSTGQRGIG